MDAFEFLETLPNATLERLYEDPWACQAVFQALPALAQQFVVRLLACDAPVPRHALQQWVHALPQPATSNELASSPTHRANRAAVMPPQFDHALEKLVRLRVFQLVANDSYQPHAAFQKQLRVRLAALVSVLTALLTHSLACTILCGRASMR